MAKIFFSMAGEGRGHATRVRSVVEELRRDHQLVLYASGAAHQMLTAAYEASDDVAVRSIPGLQFAYRGGRLDYFKSLYQSLPYLFRLDGNIAALEGVLRRERPDLVVTDFEPLLPRAARRSGVPFVSFNHQHFLVTYDLSSLPWDLRWKAWLLGRFVAAFYSGQRETIVSSFFFPPLKPGAGNVTQVGVLLRPALLEAASTVGDHVLVYLRRFARENLMQALRGCGREVRIYGLGARPPEGNLRFFQVDEEGFLKDLASCYALISNAGNQLVGEALYLHKPMLALPESGNFEQAVNGHFLRQSGGGDWMDYESLTAQDLRRFFEKVPAYRSQIDAEGVYGNDAALEAISAHLPKVERVGAPQAAMLVA